MVRIYEAEGDVDRALVRTLFHEYLQWVYANINREFGVSLDAEAVLASDMANLESFTPPHGRILLAAEGARAAGIGCLRKIGDDTAEIKRMYVRPDFRGKGIGRALLEALVAEARTAGYRRVRLDSGPFMKAAHALYRSVGFHKIEPYPESEIPPAFHEQSVFMEKQLS